MTGELEEGTWSILLNRINRQRCLPFLGAGASSPPLPLGSTVAANWAREYDYPGDNPRDLAEVAQFLAVQFDPLVPKEKILEQLAGTAPPDFNTADEPHGLLADLPLPVYLTTNYDDFMVRALEARHRPARRELCRWSERIKDEPSVFDNDEYSGPTLSEPLVFHLHGHTKPESIVLTEDDYVEFLVEVGRDLTKLLPARIRQALSRSTCLFIGYRLADLDFRVVFRPIYTMGFYRSIVVLKPPSDGDLAQRQRKYLDRYYGRMGITVYWGTARAFAAELRERWKKFKAESDNA